MDRDGSRRWRARSGARVREGLARARALARQVRAALRGGWAAAGPSGRALSGWLRRLALQAQGGRRRVQAFARRLEGRYGTRVREALASGRVFRGATVRQALARLARPFGLRGWRWGVAVAATGVGALLVLAALLGGRPGAPRLAPGPGRLVGRPPYPEIIGFYENGWSAIFRSSFPSVVRHYRVIDTVLAFWYSVDGTGAIHAHAPDPGVAQWIKAHHMRMGVLINNIPGPAGDNGAMLTDPDARRRAVQNIVSVVDKDGYQEVNIDFELLRPATRDGLTAFLRQLRQALPAGVVLSQSVFPKLGVTSDINGAYDYPALAQYADYLVIMLYDKHSDGGPAGPVSPYPWVVDNMNWMLNSARIPARKLVLAAGVYGYDWVLGSTQAQELPLTQVTAKMHAVGARRRVDPASQNPYFTYTDADGNDHVVWYQDRTTVQQRLRLAQRLGLRGLAIWALGEETPGVWSAIEETWGPSK